MSRVQNSESRARCYRPQRSRQHAFSLVEVIGFLAILGIVAAVSLRALVREIDTRYVREERAAMRSYADALQRGIMRHGYIPSHTNWTSTVANELGLDPAKVAQSSRRQPRLLLIDPGDIFSVTNLPFTQTAQGGLLGDKGIRNGNLLPLNPPQRARFILASSVGQPLPISAGLMTTNDFAALWNGVPGANPWSGFKADDLILERIDLSPRLIATLLVSDATAGQYSIGTNSTVFPVDDLPRFFTENTVLRLHHSPGHATSPWGLDSQHVLIRNASFYYGSYVWHSGATGAPKYGGTDLAAVARQFMTSIPNQRAPDQQQKTIVLSMINFMSNYVRWKDEYNLAPGTMRNHVLATQVEMMLQTQRIFLREGSTERYPINNTACN